MAEAAADARPPFPLVWLLALVTLARLSLAATLPLGIDEAYAVAVSRAWSLSYFDHPPLAFNLARLAADILGSEHRLAVRLPMQLLALGSALVLHDLTRVLYGRAAAWWAVALFATAPFFAVMAGAVVPDSPLVLGVLLVARLLLPLLDVAPARRNGWIWLMGGGALALAGLSKYHAVLLMAAGGLALLATAGGRRWLATPWPWLALAIGAIGLAPALWWNAEHGWVSLAFQGSRAGSATRIEWLNAARMWGGQGLYLGPLAVLAIGFGLTHRGRSGGMAGWRDSERGLVVLAAVLILPFLMSAFVARGSLPHWTMAGWSLLLPPAGAWLASASSRWRRGLAVQAGVLALVAIAAVAQARTGALTAGFAAQPSFDDTREFSDWEEIGPQLRDAGIDPEGAAIVASTWIEAAKIAVALGPRARVGVLSDDQRHFAHVETAQAARRRPDVVLRAVAPARAEAERQRFGAMLAAGPWEMRPMADLRLRRGGGRVFLTLLAWRRAGSGQEN